MMKNNHTQSNNSYHKENNCSKVKSSMEANFPNSTDNAYIDNFEQHKGQVDEMKKAYDNCPVPPEALDRVKAGIRKANKKHLGIRFGKIAGTSVAAAGLGIVLLANSSAGIAHAMDKIPVIGAIAHVVTFRNYTDTEGNFEANVEIPKIQADGLDHPTSDTTPSDGKQTDIFLGANRSIEEYAQQLIDMYEHDLKESEGEGNYTLESTYDVVYESDKMLSLRINSLVIMAGGNEFVKIFHVDKTDGSLLTLTDLIPDGQKTLKKINKEILSQMHAQMKKDDTISYFIKSKEEPYGFDTVSEDTNFYLNQKGELVIVFDEYEVAPGFMGVVEFTIPTDVVSVSGF